MGSSEYFFRFCPSHSLSSPLAVDKDHSGLFTTSDFETLAIGIGDVNSNAMIKIDNDGQFLGGELCHHHGERTHRRHHQCGTSTCNSYRSSRPVSSSSSLASPITIRVFRRASLRALRTSTNCAICRTGGARCATSSKYRRPYHAPA